MLAKLRTFSLLGIDAVSVVAEVDVWQAAIPKTVLVGLPEAAVRESTHRVERALVNSGFRRPSGRVVINLAPAELPKQAASFDLPISLGILAGDGQLDPQRFDSFAVVGELALDGRTRPVRGALSMVLQAAQDSGLQGVVVPTANASEAAVVADIDVIGVECLADAAAFFAAQVAIEPTESSAAQCLALHGDYGIDFSDVRGQEMAKRALQVAAAGGHNVLMVGPPGSGKTMVAKRVASILPPLTPSEAIETTRILSSLGKISGESSLVATRPYREPHHTISDAGMVGGGNPPTPGEISQAHNGVLFLDELPEFNRRTLEVLRQPLESRAVTISRVHTSTTFPADFMLIAALNPCPCGYRNDPRRECHCTPGQIERYMGKVSGPLIDRIDIQIEVPAVPFAELSTGAAGTSSRTMRQAVVAARQLQQRRFVGTPTRHNSQMTHQQTHHFCRLSAPCRRLLRDAMQELGLSARAHDKILRVARTIADLDRLSNGTPNPHRKAEPRDSGEISVAHLTEAVQYRLLDRQLWT